MSVRYRTLWVFLVILSLTAVVRAQEPSQTPEPTTTTSAPATTSPSGPQAAFLPYQCTFDTQTNSAQIHAVLMGSDGHPISTSQYTVQVTPEGSQQPLAADQVTTIGLDKRPPLQMILVLDITDTVPIDQIVDAISTHLAPQLDVQDQVALLAFSETISPL